MIIKAADSQSSVKNKSKQRLKSFVILMLLIVYAQTLTAFAQRSGDLDTTFNGNGFVTTSLTSDTEQASDLVIQADGKIVVVGDTRIGSNIDFVVLRYNADGTLDSTFDSDGIVTTAIGNRNEEARAVALQSDGKIVVVGYSDNGIGQSDFAVVRYNFDGTLDTTFNGTGKVTTAIGSIFDYAEDVAVQEDGKIVVVGRFSTGSNSNEDFAIVRYNPNGSLDTTFSFDGKETTAVGPGKETVGSVLLQPDGKIIVAGSANTSTNSEFEFYDFAVVRYYPNGMLDTTFDFDGIATTAVGLLADFGRDAQLQTDGKIVVTGLSQASDYNFGTIRYNSDGSLDLSFGNNGKVITDLGGYESANSVAIQTDGKIIIVGGSYGFTIIRYHVDGSLDNSLFGGNGIVTKPDGSARAVAIQTDGKIVAAGIGPYNGTFDIRVARYIGNNAPSTQNATIKGRVLSPLGRGLPRAFVQITKENGITQTVVANSLGHYHFEGIEIGQNVTLKVTSKQFQFQVRTVTVDKNIMNLIHIGFH